MKKVLNENLRRKRKYLGTRREARRVGRKEIVRNVRGKRGNAPIYRAQKWG